MTEHTARTAFDTPRATGDAAGAIPATARPLPFAVRIAPPGVRGAVVPASGPIRRSAREPLETDGPATCLI